MAKPRYKRPAPMWRKFLALSAAGLMFCVFIIIIVGFFKNGEGQSTGNKRYSIGDQIDSLDGVAVYFNGPVGNVSGRTVADGYNIGLKYQCVEFVKRYYYEALNHKMPDPWGHAIDFFNPNLKDGEFNEKRGLIQYTNGSISKPQKGDLLVFAPTAWNQYGHVAIVSRVSSTELEYIQQNPGPSQPSREKISYSYDEVGQKWQLRSDRLLGWLRK